jgi:hypothetical protein
MRKEFASRSTLPSPFASPGIEFELPYRASVTLRLLDTDGAELVTVLARKPYEEGVHHVDLGEFGKNVAFYQLSIDRDGVVFTDTKRISMTV